MKLYTEQELRKHLYNHDEKFFEELTPVELPKYMKEETQNLEELINALCIVKAGYGNESENLVYRNALEIINKRVDYLHLLNQKNEIENKLQTYNQNK